MQNGRISLKKVDGRIQALVSDMFMNILLPLGLQSTELVVWVSVWQKSFSQIIRPFQLMNPMKIVWKHEITNL